MHGKQQELKIVIVDKLQALEELLKEDAVSEQWRAIEQSFISICKEVLSPTKQHHKLVSY